MKIDTYIEIPSGTTMSHDLQPADGRIELQIGAELARNESTVRLLVSDPDTLTDLARIALEARGLLVNEMRLQINAAERAGDPVAKRVRQIAFPAANMLAIGDESPVFGTFDQLELGDGEHGGA